MRYTLQRWIPKGSRAIRIKGLENTVVYVTDSQRVPGRVVGVAYTGKAVKPSWNYQFRSMQGLNDYVAKWVDGLKAAQAFRDSRKAARKAFTHSLKVGDVLRSSWGYDQTNINYYEVTKLIGSKMVEVREIGQQQEQTGFMSGDCVPAVGQYIGKPTRHRVSEGNSVKISECQQAYLITPKVVGGVKVYGVDHWSSYH